MKWRCRHIFSILLHSYVYHPSLPQFHNNPLQPPKTREQRKKVRLGKGVYISLDYFLLIRDMNFLRASAVSFMRISLTSHPAIAKAAKATAGTSSSRDQQQVMISVVVLWGTAATTSLLRALAYHISTLSCIPRISNIYNWQKSCPSYSTRPA